MADKENSGTPAGNSQSNISADAADHASELIDSAPDVQEHVVAQQAAQESGASGAENPGTEKRVDKFGTVFDPAKHTGSVLKNGAWRERKISGSSLKTSKPKKASAQDAQVASDLDAQSMAAGAAAAQSYFAVTTMLFGAEWQPLPAKEIGYDEMELTAKAFGDVFKQKGVTDFPPMATLSMVLLGGIARRLQMPETQKKVGGIKNWFALRFAKWRVKKEFRKRGVVASVEIKNGELWLDGKPEREYRNAAK